MKVFVGFGYNDRDRWIEEQVFPILREMGFVVVDGKDMHGRELQPEVQHRIQQSDTAIGFFTIREGQGDADFNSHMWVRDELVHANAKKIPIIPIKEVGVNVPDGLLGDRQYIPLNQTDRLACVTELATALGGRSIRRLKLESDDDDLRRNIWRWRKDAGFAIKYRTRDNGGLNSRDQDGRLELVEQGFYLNISDVLKGGLVEVEGFLAGVSKFSSGWVSTDAVGVKVN
jgi:hypothetical protein